MRRWKITVGPNADRDLPLAEWHGPNADAAMVSDRGFISIDQEDIGPDGHRSFVLQTDCEVVPAQPGVTVEEITGP